MARTRCELMEYLVYLGFFALGWVLAKFDSVARLKAKIQVYTEQVYTAGVKQGHLLTIKHLQENEGHVKMGFDIKPNSVNAKKED